MSKKPVVKPKTSKADTKSRSNTTVKDETESGSRQNMDKDEEFARQLQVQ